MSFYPFNYKNQRLQSDVKGIGIDRSFIAHFHVDATKATVANTTGIHAPVSSTGENIVITDNIAQPSMPRNITATAGGIATDIKAVQVIIEGTNYNDEVITETLTAFTVDTAGTVTGNKAFKTITKITIPAHDGTGATTSIGFGEKLGLPYKLSHNTILAAYFDNVKEGTVPTVAMSATALENNTIDLNSNLNSKVIDAYLII